MQESQFGLSNQETSVVEYFAKNLRANNTAIRAEILRMVKAGESPKKVIKGRSSIIEQLHINEALLSTFEAELTRRQK